MLTSTESGALRCVDAAGRQVWRVGFAPEPWAWTPWEYADGGRFTGRWDDPRGVWRTLYVGESRLVCFLEVLAPFRPDPRLAADLDQIQESDDDATEHPSAAPGNLTREWCAPRRAGAARLTGWFAAPADAESLPTLRAKFLPLAVHHGLSDVDAAAIRLAEPRAVTQAIAAWLYEQNGPQDQPLAGTRFESRHGDGLLLWAIFERSDDGPVSPLLTDLADTHINADDPDLLEAMRIHRIVWAEA